MTNHHRVPTHHQLVADEIEDVGIENIYGATFVFLRGLGGSIVEANLTQEAKSESFRFLVEFSSGFTLGVHYWGKNAVEMFDHDGFLVYQHYSDNEFFVLPTFAAFTANTMKLMIALSEHGLDSVECNEATTVEFKINMPKPH